VKIRAKTAWNATPENARLLHAYRSTLPLLEPKGLGGEIHSRQIVFHNARMK
jgi:hypothetical protein